MLDPQSKTLQETTALSPRTAGGRQPNPVYELFVLGELMVQPLYGYVLHEIVNKILGPFHRLSWGTIYPLIRRLEQEGFLTSQVQKRREGFLQTERGPLRKVYSLTEVGHGRFFALMLAHGDYNPDYPDLFAMKFTKFGYLTPAQRLAILEHYRTFLLISRDHYREVGNQVLHNPEIIEIERPYVLRLVEGRVGTLEKELSWLDSQITDTTHQL
ncbi:MAG TPA: PadR family transcriptional regulator [Ktedonobacteraceae bacterium]|nr:PadR family transcriptional regulator [Ktedonobacteraceae bacterium]